MGKDIAFSLQATQKRKTFYNYWAYIENPPFSLYISLCEAEAKSSLNESLSH